MFFLAANSTYKKHHLTDIHKRPKVKSHVGFEKCGWQLSYLQSLFLLDAFRGWQAAVIYQARVQEGSELGKLWVSHSLMLLHIERLCWVKDAMVVGF